MSHQQASWCLAILVHLCGRSTGFHTSAWAQAQEQSWSVLHVLLIFSHLAFTLNFQDDLGPMDAFFHLEYFPPPPVNTSTFY